MDSTEIGCRLNSCGSE